MAQTSQLLVNKCITKISKHSFYIVFHMLYVILNKRYLKDKFHLLYMYYYYLQQYICIKCKIFTTDFK